LFCSARCVQGSSFTWLILYKKGYHGLGMLCVFLPSAPFLWIP
jgi:hypothetical protein